MDVFILKRSNIVSYQDGKDWTCLPLTSHSLSGTALYLSIPHTGMYTHKHTLIFLLLLLHCCFTSTVNIYTHVGTVSKPNHTFPGQA